MPEILDHGLDAYLVRSIDEAVDAVQAIGTLDRGVCRRIFEERFSAERMARDYLNVYERIIGSSEREPRLDPWAA